MREVKCAGGRPAAMARPSVMPRFLAELEARSAEGEVAPNAVARWAERRLGWPRPLAAEAPKPRPVTEQETVGPQFVTPVPMGQPWQRVRPPRA